jgi:LPS sulfotransferase NodH
MDNRSEMNARPEHLRYRTNGSEFDFPVLEAEPQVRYVLASTPRCGSNMLQRALWRTGQAGAPEEYFAPGYVHDYLARWPEIGRSGSAPTDGYLGIDVERYLELLFRHRSSPNAVFGVKFHSSHLAAFHAAGIDPAELLASPVFIWVRRRDLLRQAISWYLAEETGVWIVDGDWLPLDTPRAEPEYDYSDLKSRVAQLQTEDARWAAYFHERAVRFLVVYYEDLCASYDAIVKSCFAFMGLNVPEAIEEPGIQRQASDRNANWRSRLEDDLAQAGEVPPALPSI